MPHDRLLMLSYLDLQLIVSHVCLGVSKNLTCGTSRWPRMRCVQMSSGVSESPDSAAANADGPPVCK
jgi:hypothetical protein